MTTRVAPATPTAGDAVAEVGADTTSVTDATEAQLQQSFASANAIAAHYPQYASQITAAAQSSFLDGANWAYAAGIVAICVGAALVFLFFPKRDDELRMIAEFHAEDTAAAAGPGAARGPAGGAGTTA